MQFPMMTSKSSDWSADRAIGPRERCATKKCDELASPHEASYRVKLVHGKVVELPS